MHKADHVQGCNLDTAAIQGAPEEKGRKVRKYKEKRQSKRSGGPGAMEA